jgi:hypothetical protein
VPGKYIDPADETMAVGSVALTKPGPHWALIIFAALMYVLEIGWLRFAALASSTAIVFCRQALQVGLAPPMRLSFKARS